MDTSLPTEPSRLSSVDDLSKRLLQVATEWQTIVAVSRHEPPQQAGLLPELLELSAPPLPARHRFALALRYLRERSNISQNELARRAGLTSGYVSKLENARSSLPARQALDAIADALGVPPQYLGERAGLVSDDLVEYIQDNTIILQFLQEARAANLPPHSWVRLLGSLHDEIRVSIDALGTDRERPINIRTEGS